MTHHVLTREPPCNTHIARQEPARAVGRLEAAPSVEFEVLSVRDLVLGAPQSARALEPAVVGGETNRGMRRPRGACHATRVDLSSKLI